MKKKAVGRKLTASRQCMMPEQASQATPLTAVLSPAWRREKAWRRASQPGHQAFGISSWQQRNL